MIESFASKLAQLIYDGVDSPQSRRFPEQLHNKAQRLLDLLNSATQLQTLTMPPANHLEKLQGELAGYWSLRINKQWRITFRWESGNAYQVDIIDYH